MFSFWNRKILISKFPLNCSFDFLNFSRSNLSSRFAVTNEALNNLPEFPDLNVPILVDDILSKQVVQSNKLNRTEFIRQLEDFR